MSRVQNPSISFLAFCLNLTSRKKHSTIIYEQAGKEHVLDNVDTLIFACGYHIDPAMEDMLKEANATYHLIGDGEKVGNLRDAITRAYEVVKNI